MIGATAHRVIAGAETAAHHHGELGDFGAGHRHHHFGAVFGDSARFGFLPDHETGDVLQEHQRDAALGAQFDEVRALERRFGKQDAVIGDDADRVAVQMGESADQRGAVQLLERVKFAAVHQAGDDLVNVERFSRVRRNDAPEFCGGIRGLHRWFHFQVDFFAVVEVGDDAPGDAEGVRIVFGIVVGDAGGARMQVGAAKFLGTDFLAGGGRHQRRAGEKDGALLADDDALVRHRREICAAGGARAHHHRDLRNAGGGQIRLVVENPPEVVAVGKHFILSRQKRAAGIHQIDAGQAVVRGDFLGAQVFFHRERVVGSAFDRGIVGDEYAFQPADPADSGDQSGGGDFVFINLIRRQLGELEKRGGGVEELADSFSW